MVKRVSNRIGLLIAFGIISLIVGWRVWMRSQKYAHLAEIADEIGSIAELRHPYFVPNNAGTRLLVNMDAEKGPGVYLFDIASRENRLLHQDEQHGYDYRQYKLLGWSPDDSLLAYGHQAAPKTNDNDSVPGDLIIADGASGKTLATIRVAADSTNTLFQFAWLSSNSFAYLNAAQDLFVYEHKVDAWVETRSFTNATGGNWYEAQVFGALSPTTVMWRMRNTLWTFDITSGLTSKLWESFTNSATTNTLVASWYSKETGKFLFICYDRAQMRGQRQGLYTFDPADRSLTRIVPIRQGILPENPPASINHGQGYEFMSPEVAYTTLWLSTTNGTNPVTMFRRGEVRTAVVHGDHIFVAATLTNEPPGIWDYNVSSGSLECILSCATHGLKYTECVPFEVTTLTNVAGQRFSYHLWKHAHFSADKKYPLIIGNSPYSWTPFPLAAANTGYYFVTVDRPSWTSPMTDWVEKLMTAYQDLQTNVNIDTNRVMICVRSIESEGLAPLISKNPKIWKGAILFDPTTVPDFSHEFVSKIFIASGEFEAPVLQGALAAKDRAERAGIPVKLTILKGAGHVSYGVGVQQQRIAALVEFLSEN